MGLHLDDAPPRFGGSKGWLNLWPLVEDDGHADEREPNGDC